MNQPLAVVGMACRFPKIDDIQSLWTALCSGFNAADDVPADRWDADRYYSKNEVSKGKSYVRRGGFVNQDVKSFDASFFGISPREAENMDPQQRLILEVVWEAFENCGLVLPDYAGRNVGVYVGGFMLDHMITQMSMANRSQINQHSAAGMMMTMLSNRVSHTYDFRGPSLSIDTACSSSLVAFHYACQDVWRGACEMAIVGGTNVMMRPEYPMGMCKGHFLSRDGESKSFDSRGDGYGRGEGAGVLLLKPLASALADGDTILSCVVGTGTNQDGHTPGISMPNGDSQRTLIEQVCEQYQVDPRTMDYVECHGTGTAIGDPTECKAIGETYGAGRSTDNPVVIGSIKSNIGHLEAAAGVAGVIKGVLTVMHRKATPLGNLQQPHEEIEFQDLGVRLSDSLIDLGTGDEPIRVAVNSFGYGGSNAHVLLESPPKSLPMPTANSFSTNGHAARRSKLRPTNAVPFALPVSGRCKNSVAANAALIADHLENADDPLKDVIYTAAHRRAHLSNRAVAMGRSREEVVASLRSIAEQQETDFVVQDVQPYQGVHKPVFVFTGMGPQWWSMGQELYRNQPVYRDAVDEADVLFQEVAGFSILEEMLKNEKESRVQETVYAQPANFVLQLGITAMLRDLGIKPGAIVGHSVGELGSAYESGVLSLHDALKVSFHRSQLQAETAGTGGMLALGLGKEEAMKRIEDCPNLLSLAAVNSPSSVTLAGYTPSIERLAEELTMEGIFNRKLDVEIPYHSPMMDSIMPRLEAALSGVVTSAPHTPLYSTVTGEIVTTPSFGADYWPQNVRQPVEFEAAINAILEVGYTTFVEIGPHPVLSTSLRDCIKLAGKECRLVHTLRRSLPDESLSVHRAAMSIFATGCDVDWSRHTDSSTFVSLPNYSWQRERHWSENDRAMQDRVNPVIYPILGTQEALAAPVWRNDFDHQTVEYLRDHVIKGVPILPAAGYLEALLELGSIQFPDSAGLAVRDIEIKAPMIIAAERGLDFTTTYDANSSKASIRSLENGRLGTGVVHLNAKLAGIQAHTNESVDLKTLRRAARNSADTTQFYRDLSTVGLNYERLFQTVRELYLQPEQGTVLARVEIDETLTGDLDQYLLHPTMLDGCFQTLIAMLNSTDTTYLPTHIEEFCVYTTKAPTSLWCIGEMVSRSANSVTCNLRLTDESGVEIAVVRGLRATAAARGDRTDQYGDRVKRQLLAYQWEHGLTLAEPKRLGHWLSVGSAGDLSALTNSRLEGYGATLKSVVNYGDKFQQSGSQFVVRHDSVHDAQRVLEQSGDLDGIVFFAALDDEIRSDCPTGEKALNALIIFSKALQEIPLEKRPRVYVVTHAAFQMDEYDGVVNPASATINGFVRVASNELDGFRFTTVDLPADLDDDTVIESLVLELVCDAEEDEVAIRGDLRLVSELMETGALTNDVILPTNLDNEHPVLIRPLRTDTESVGTVRVLAATPAKPIGDEVLIAVEMSLLPFDLIQDQSSEQIQQPCIEIVGRVLGVGDQVKDLQAGTRVCGFVPAELTSHVCASRSDIFVTAIDDDASASVLISGMTTQTRAKRGVEPHALAAGDTALVVASPMGHAIAAELAKHGVSVTYLCQDAEEASGIEGPAYIASPASLQNAIDIETKGKRFDVLVAGMESWARDFDLRTLAAGGRVIDTDESASSIQLPPHVDGISRTSIEGITRHPAKLEEALKRTVEDIMAGEVEDAPVLDVSIADLGWQQLPLQDTDSRVAISYNTHGKDLPMVQTDCLTFDSDATYLITGGFGGFGFKTAVWLAKQGVRHLVLTGRQGANTPEKQAQVAELESCGANVKAAACDTADFDSLKLLFDDIAKTMPPLKGVIHSGAVILDQAIVEADLETVNTVIRSKALGAWNLHLLTEQLELDHFVMYSSLANLIGNSRQSAYCAANGYLNGLAQMRNANGLPATSVNWGAISDVGVVAKDDKLEQFLRHVGLRGMTSAESLDLLHATLARNIVQVGVVLIKSWADWARFETVGSRSPRFTSLVAADSEAADNGLRDQLVAELASLPPVDQVDLMASLIVQIVASVLKADAENISVDRPINELGIDSLMAAEIQVKFETELGMGISVLELIGDITVRSLSGKMLDSLQAELQKASTTTVAAETREKTEAETQLTAS
ncbi:MAG: SDR family NAD(P)-dependent oxidoreductase [Rubripirellula sp.]